jgi:mercuric ion transport protein
MTQQKDTNKNPKILTDNKASVATGGAVGLSAISSFIGLCCIGPWAVTLFGISGAIAMARWQPYRPYILGIALAMIVWAYWRVYGPARKKLCEAGLCPARPSIWLQSGLWLTTVLVVMAFFADQLQWMLIDATPEGLRQ